jgi:hypothetical protein
MPHRTHTRRAALLPFAEKMKTARGWRVGPPRGVYGQEANELTIEAFQTIGQYLLLTFVASFLRVHPKARVTARSGNTDQDHRSSTRERNSTRPCRRVRPANRYPY